MVLENLNQIAEEAGDDLATCVKDLTKEIIFNGDSQDVYKKLRIIHFNDVYNIEPSTREPKGGAARFLTAINYLKQESPSILLFSGDIFSPSPCNKFLNNFKFF